MNGQATLRLAQGERFRGHSDEMLYYVSPTCGSAPAGWDTRNDKKAGGLQRLSLFLGYVRRRGSHGWRAGGVKTGRFLRLTLAPHCEMRLIAAASSVVAISPQEKHRCFRMCRRNMLPMSSS